MWQFSVYANAKLSGEIKFLGESELLKTKKRTRVLLLPM